MALIPPFFLDCVTAIGFKDASGQTKFGATGFLLGKVVQPGPTPEATRYRVYLVTNRHVFEGHEAAVLRFNPDAETPARTYDLALVDEVRGKLYSLHTDPAVDVAAIPINTRLLNEHKIRFSFFDPERHVVRLSGAEASDISEGDSVFVLGFPFGDTGVLRNYVVVRHGVLARVRDTIAGASPTFLIDASVFPGNSGGPVVTKPDVVAISGTRANRSANLIGIVSAYVTYKDVAVSSQTHQPRVVFEENSGLAVVVPTERILEVVNTADARGTEPPGGPTRGKPS